MIRKRVLKLSVGVIMRKQTKIAAIVSAAALLAVGASMTSFAATGWQEEDGTWVYYNKAEEKVTDKWAKSGDNWFYLDSDGYMATDMLIEDDDDYYYVDANGAMVRNQWIAIDNEDAGNDEDEPEVHWYYFQNNGKAYKRKGNSTMFKKSINGKTYCFNDEGQMQYGWVKRSDGETDSAEEAWQDAEYYFGDENDGAMSVGWRLISLTDTNDTEDQQPGDSFWDEDQDRWFYFASSGKKKTDKDGTTINGKKYGFDKYGRMIADWALPAKDADGKIDPGEPASSSLALKSSTATNAQKAAYTEEFMYFSSPEDGARYTKHWFKVIPGAYLDDEKYDDGESFWYYAVGDGTLVANQIKSIKSKKYAFDERGRMLKGLVLLEMIDTREGGTGKVNTKYINDKIDDDDDENPYDTKDNFDSTARKNLEKLAKHELAFYFFSNDEDHDGSMKTGKQTIDLDGDTCTFKFYTSGSYKGQGVTGVEDKKLYMGGKLITAGGDEKFQFVDLDTGKKYNVADFINGTNGASVLFEKDDTYNANGKHEDEVRYVLKDADGFKAKYALVNTSGAVLTSGTKKDGDDYRIKLGKASVTTRTDGVFKSGKQVKTATVEEVILK